MMIEKRLLTGEMEGGDLGFFTVLDILLLSHCDYFIGAFSGNLGRLAYELMFAIKECYPPFVTLDIPWCYHWGYPWKTGHLKHFFC